MQDQWYGDKRDLVKWGVLVELASHFGTEHILQVLYYRATALDKPLEIDGRSVNLPAIVMRQFRNVGNIASLGGKARVELIDSPFADRDKYLDHVLERIRARRVKAGIVFLDPDTGLQSRNPGLEHVLEFEVRSIWQEMHRGDVLVFYQHKTNRSGAEWINPKKQQLENALGVPSGAVKVARAPTIARDVVLFFIEKTKSESPSL
jgi:hypothetical protein